MFDLPVDSQPARRNYTRFRNLLIKHGFYMMQFSVYARYFQSEEASETIRRRIRQGLPPHGHVRLLLVTDKQFGKMDVFHGKKKEPTEKSPDQLLLF